MTKLMDVLKHREDASERRSASAAEFAGEPAVQFPTRCEPDIARRVAPAPASQFAANAETAKPMLAHETHDDEISGGEPETVTPFIEIDGATRTLAGSPDVLAVPVTLASRRQDNQAATRRPTSVSARLTYQPWPASCAGADCARVAPELIVFHDPRHSASQHYVELLGQLLHTERPPQALMFTARTAAIGLSVPVLNLAVAATQKTQRKVIVLGMEGKGSSVSGCLGLSLAPNLEQVLAGKIAIEQAIQISPVPNLSVLPIGAVPFNSDVWGRGALRWVLTWLRGRYQYLFVEVGVWSGSAQQILLANMCDAVFPFLTGDESQQPESQQFLQMIAAQGGPIRGVLQSQGK
jgi:Mrp family chromosome partitioning ATPase